MRFSSAAHVSFPPWPPNLRLERQGGYLSPPLVEWLSFAVFFCSLGRSAYRARFSGRDVVSVDRLVSYLPLCGRCGCVGGLRTASACTAFALVVSVGPVVVFLTASDLSDTALA